MTRMLKEIREQPGVLEKAIRGEGAGLGRLAGFLKGRAVPFIVLVARGSSDNAALFGRYLLEIATGIPVSLCAPSVYTIYDSVPALKGALVVGISQSGEGTDINEVLTRARAAGAFTLGITNRRGSSITEAADACLYLHAGREHSVAATKTFTAQMLQFYLLANALRPERQMDLQRIPEDAARALELESTVAEIAERYTFVENCVVVGRGLNYGNAFELALKLMETCYVVAERFSSADFRHGPLAIVERRFPVIVFAPKGAVQRTNIDLVRELRDLGADCLSITNDRPTAKLSSRAIAMDGSIPELLSPIPFAIPGQLFAAHLSLAKGLDPDNPRSLSKITRTF